MISCSAVSCECSIGITHQWNCSRSRLSVPILLRLRSIAAVAMVRVISSGRGTHLVKNCVKYCVGAIFIEVSSVDVYIEERILIHRDVNTCQRLTSKWLRVKHTYLTFFSESARESPFTKESDIVFCGTVMIR
jgi:hypothetical protein